MHFRIRGLTAGVLSLAVVACTDLGAVREWSETSLEATQYSQVVANYADTPNRLKRFDAAAADAYSRQAETRAGQAKALEKELELVAEYMAALHTLAGGDTIDYREDADGFVSSLKALDTGISDESLAAAGGLVTTLAQAALEAWQEDEVTDLITRANAPLQALLAGHLRTVVARDFKADLEIEQGLANTYFKPLLRDHKASETANAALREWQEVYAERNAARQHKISAYLEVLDTIAEGHQALYDNRDDLDAKKLAKRLFKLAKNTRKHVADLLDA